MGNPININKLMPDLGDRERKFVLASVRNDDNAAANAREAGYPENSAAQRASELNKKPEIQQAIADLRERIGDTGDLDVKQFVTDGLLEIAMKTKGADRDKLNALQLLGKTEAMFTDVVESKDTTDDDKLLDQIEKEFGADARAKAEEEMGIDATQEE